MRRRTCRTTVAPHSGIAPPPKPAPKQPPLPQQLLLGEAKVRFDAAATADIGFVERLVWFWSNHFCISADKVVGMAGPYRARGDPPACARPLRRSAAGGREPSGDAVLSRQCRSRWARTSIAGINRDKGLNENLARETLELHTLGVRSGYTQADVTSFANVLTGWSWIDPSRARSRRRVRLRQTAASAGRSDRARQALSRYRRRARPRRARRSGAASGHRTAHRREARGAFCRRQPAADARRQACQKLPGQRRRSQASRRNAGDGGRILGAAAAEAKAAGRMDRRRHPAQRHASDHSDRPAS